LGRYFGFRASSLTTLLSVPLPDLQCLFRRVEQQGLRCGVVSGVSRGGESGISAHGGEPTNSRCPQVQQNACLNNLVEPKVHAQVSIRDTNFLIALLLVYGCLALTSARQSLPAGQFGFRFGWAHSTRVWAGANLIMLVLVLADRLGNRPLLLVGIWRQTPGYGWLGLDLTQFPSVATTDMLSGGTWAAIELCNNIQMEVAPLEHPFYFAIAAAVAGVCGALGTTAGGSWLTLACQDCLFLNCCTIGRSVTLVREPRSQPLVQV